MPKRISDIITSLLALIILSPILILIALLVKLTSKGAARYWTERVGRNNINFQMPKFRTMRIDTPQVATHLMKEPEKYLTPIGKFLRKTIS